MCLGSWSSSPSTEDEGEDGEDGEDGEGGEDGEDGEDGDDGRKEDGEDDGFVRKMDLEMEEEAIELGTQLWMANVAETADLSSSLCEQLRLVLEPKLASQLKGDYRTGKRINMRKVIPYIASQFKRDKIWVRRTKPSKRMYQVLLAIDDSESMAEQGAGATALATMTMMAQALTKLEVGQLGIVSFGEDVKELHPLGAPFNASAGSEVMSSFSFAQQSTAVDSLLKTSLKILEDARLSVRGPEHVQLMFIISDGVIPNRDAVKQYVRDASTRNMVLVFVIIDSGDEDKSILNRSSVSFVNGQVVVEPALDGFPFEYYVVTDDVSTLPDVVAAILRQWFASV